MAGESDEPDGAAARLEAALERIAAAAAHRAKMADTRQAAQEAAARETNVTPPVAAPSVSVEAIDPEITARLDGLIERLRGALAVRPG